MLEKSIILETVKDSPRIYWVEYQLKNIEGKGLTHRQFVDILRDVDTECHIYGVGESWFDLYDRLNQLYWSHFTKPLVFSPEDQSDLDVPF